MRSFSQTIKAKLVSQIAMLKIMQHRLIFPHSKPAPERRIELVAWPWPWNSGGTRIKIKVLGVTQKYYEGLDQIRRFQEKFSGEVFKKSVQQKCLRKVFRRSFQEKCSGKVFRKSNQKLSVKPPSDKPCFPSPHKFGFLPHKSRSGHKLPKITRYFNYETYICLSGSARQLSSNKIALLCGNY